MSETDKQERRTHFRGKARPGRRVELDFMVEGEDGHEPIRAFTRNIGVGGAYIVTDSPQPVGAKLHIQIRVPTTESPISVSAEVRWSSAHGAEDGMGVQFHNMNVDQLLQLSEYFASLTGSESAM